MTYPQMMVGSNLPSKTPQEVYDTCSGGRTSEHAARPPPLGWYPPETDASHLVVISRCGPPADDFSIPQSFCNWEGSTQHTQQNKNGKSQSVSPSFQGRTISNPLACLFPGKP